ncbi:hypothetical protein C7S16_5128 [Burkholderia thailandensis]|uniref:Uncharacterized protein n=1 Tax=Burkholderia thailandensis TaxID=57975 RepID=A0AAW9CJE5_BURTH|nr:hypothetical protein [Burkholderia thailandensis]
MPFDHFMRYKTIRTSNCTYMSNRQRIHNCKSYDRTESFG